MYIYCLVILAIIQLSVGEECQKLVKFGDTIENKAHLSKTIVVTENITLIGNIIIVTSMNIIKGNIPDDQKSIVVNKLASKGAQSDICKYKKVTGKIIMFVELTDLKGNEFSMVFNSETFTSEKLDKIKSVICKGCAGTPKPKIDEVQGKAKLSCKDPDAKLPTIVKWSLPSKPDKIGMQAILSLTPEMTSKYKIYKCTAENVAGSTDVYIQYRESVGRCTLEEDKSFCSNNGKCYSDKGEKFCRCNAPYMAKNCKQGNTVQNTISVAMTKVSVIGALIVIGGVLIILIFLVCIWRCCSRREEDTYEEDDDDIEKQVKSSQRAPKEDVPLYDTSQRGVTRNNGKFGPNVNDL